LENDFTLVVSCKNNGRETKAYIRVYDKSADKVVFEKSTDSVVINDIVPYSTILVTIKIKHKVYTHEFEAVSGGNKKIIIDICKSLEAMWEAPRDVLCKERFTARLILKNTSISDMHVKAKITVDGITIEKKIIDIILGENETKELEIEAKSADYAGDYMLYAFFPETYNVNPVYYHGRIIQTDKKSNKISVIEN
jgi:hypothetical protein